MAENGIIMNGRRCREIVKREEGKATDFIFPFGDTEIRDILNGTLPKYFAKADVGEERIEATEYLVHELRRLHNESL